MDIKAQVRALYVRSNSIVRRFCNCNSDVKKRLFNAYCLCIYGSDLWLNYSVQTFSRLRIAYNDSFRILFKIPRFDHVSPYFVENRISPFPGVIRKNMFSLYKSVMSSSNSIIMNIKHFYLFGSKLWLRWCIDLF